MSSSPTTTREADEEIRSAEQSNPDLRLTEEQRAAYRTYRWGHRGEDAIRNPTIWLPLYIANPALYSGGGGESGASGSSYNGGGGFTGGGASGSY